MATRCGRSAINDCILGLFALQEEITTAVATALQAELVSIPGAVPQSDHPPSGNLGAYNAYLQGEFPLASQRG